MQLIHVWSIKKFRFRISIGWIVGAHICCFFVENWGTSPVGLVSFPHFWLQHPVQPCQMEVAQVVCSHRQFKAILEAQNWRFVGRFWNYEFLPSSCSFCGSLMEIWLFPYVFSIFVLIPPCSQGLFMLFAVLALGFCKDFFGMSNHVKQLKHLKTWTSWSNDNMHSPKHPSHKHKCFFLHVAQRIILSIVVLETIFQVQEKIWAPRGSKRLLRWWCAIWACPLNMYPPKAEHSSGQCHSDRTCKIAASDIHACQPLALCKSLMKGAKKRYGLLGYVCSPISSMQPNLLQVFPGCDNTSGLRVDTPRFLVQTTTLSSNVIHLAHVDWSAEEIARLPSSAAGEKYTQRSKKDTSWTSLMEKVIQDGFSQAAIWNKCLALWAEKRSVYKKTRRFSTTWQCSKGGWFTEIRPIFGNWVLISKLGSPQDT